MAKKVPSARNVKCFVETNINKTVKLKWNKGTLILSKINKLKNKQKFKFIRK